MFVWSGSAWGAISTVNGAVTTGTLAQFAATTSAQLAGVISDETGSGALVFGTNPTIANATITGTLTASATSGTNGYYLKTTGTGVQWAAVSNDPIPQALMLGGM